MKINKKTTKRPRQKDAAKQNTNKNHAKSNGRKKTTKKMMRQPEGQRSISESVAKLNSSKSSHQPAQDKENGYKSFEVPGRIMAKWKPISSPTVNFISSAIDSSINSVIGMASQRSFNEISEELNELKSVLIGRIKTLAVPGGKLKSNNYNNIHSSANQLRDILKKSDDHNEKLEEMIVKYERHVEQMTEEEETLEKLGEGTPSQSLDQEELADELLQIGPTTSGSALCNDNMTLDMFRSTVSDIASLL